MRPRHAPSTQPNARSASGNAATSPTGQSTRRPEHATARSEDDLAQLLGLAPPAA